MATHNDSSVVQTWNRRGAYFPQPRIERVVLDITCDSGDGSVAPVVLNQQMDGFICRLTWIPSATAAPSGALAVTLTDENGVDVLQGLAGALAASGVTDIPIVMASTLVPAPVALMNTLTLAVSGNTNVSAKGRLVLYFSD